tara:strand:+ start:1444 stop:1641 length:198 start_codon:yes stop_codon:yes gene_type:complete
MSVKHELRFKVKGFPWKVFDTYTDRNDPDLEKYYHMLSNTKFNDGVKVIRITTMRTEIIMPDKAI